MKKYKVLYSDCGENYVWHCMAYNANDAEERFWDSMNQDDAGIRVEDIQRVKN